MSEGTSPSVTIPPTFGGSFVKKGGRSEPELFHREDVAKGRLTELHETKSAFDYLRAFPRCDWTVKSRVIFVI